MNNLRIINVNPFRLLKVEKAKIKALEAKNLDLKVELAVLDKTIEANKKAIEFRQKLGLRQIALLNKLIEANKKIVKH